MTRHVILHYHIFKNAGSSVDAILEANFPGQCGSVEGDLPWDTINSGLVLAYALDNPALKAISSHQARLPLPAHAEIEFHPIVLLRHPIDRVGSVFEFECRQDPNGPIAAVRVAREQGFAEYVRHRLVLGNGSVITNFQVIALAARETNMQVAKATHDDLEIAKLNLLDLPCFGLVENFAESMARVRDCYRQYFGELQIPTIRENQTKGRSEVLEDRLLSIEESLGPELYKELLEANQLDIALYEFAEKHFLGT